jgi:3'(2'), 5'-bisphosphate nucleotidase
MSVAARELSAAVTVIARDAGREILEVYGAKEIAATRKADASPLTQADLRAHRLILEALRKLTPAIRCCPRRRRPRPSVPAPAGSGTGSSIPGRTKVFSRNGQFTVNIALIEAHAPVLGVVHVPVREISYVGLPGAGAWRQLPGEGLAPIRVSAHSASPLRVVGSRSHRGDSLDGFLSRAGAHELLAVGSSLKFCMVAEGAADVYPRLGPTSEWDTAAAHAVVLGAGGTVSALDGAPLRYNTREELLNPFFVVYGPKDRDWLALLR